MKNKRTVFEFCAEFECQEFTDVDPDVSGIEIFKNGERLGSIVGLCIPDIDDVDEGTEFDEKVVDWLVDNDKF